MKKPKPMIIPEQPATVHSLTQQGLGIAAVEGKTTFIEGALPQETVKYRLFKKHRSYDEAGCVEVLKPSEERTQPQCEQFGICGGCSLQHLALSAQIRWKEKILLEQLDHLGQVKPETVLPPLAAAPWGYRHKARLGARFLEKENKTIVGFRKKFRSHLADLDLCHVLHPSVGKRLPDLSALLTSLEVKDQIPQIEVAIGDEETALIFRHMKPLSAADLEKFETFGRTHEIHIYLQPNPPEPISLLWPKDQDQRLHYRLPDFDLEMRFHPADFTQIHLEMNRLMVKQAVSLLDPQADETVLDLFCGIGNFSLPLARLAKQVVAIEGSQEMVERGYENARHNSISKVAFHAANLFEPGKLVSPWLSQSYDKILLDPPRSGAQEIIALFPQWSPKRIVYVSCNPATLARDAKMLADLGYHLKQAGVMNMFPHTSHIEAMAVFEKGKKP